MYLCMYVGKSFFLVFDICGVFINIFLKRRGEKGGKKSTWRLSSTTFSYFYYFVMLFFFIFFNFFLMFWRKRRQKVFSILCLVFNKIYFHHFRFLDESVQQWVQFFSVSTKKVFSFLCSFSPTRTLAMLFTTVLHSECPSEHLLCM